MNDEIVFRIRCSQRISTLLISVLLPILAIVFFLMIFPWNLLMDSMNEPMILVSFLLILVFLLFAVYNGIHIWLDRLVFTDTHFERRGLPRPRVYRGSEPYENIVEVRRGIYGSLLLETKGGKNFLFSPKSYEGGIDAIMSELRRRIPAERFQPDLETKLLKKTRSETWGMAMMIVGFVLVYLWLFYENAYDWIRNDVGWSVEVKGSLRESLEDFALGENGSIWLLIRKFPLEHTDPTSYEVRVLADGGEEIYTLPTLETLFPNPQTRPYFTFPQGIFLNETGNPELYFHWDLPWLLWNGESWNWDASPEDEEIPTRDILFEKTNDTYWKTFGENKMIHVLDPHTGQSHDLDLSSLERGYSLYYRPSPYGWIVVHIEAVEGRNFFYGSNGNAERKTWYELNPSMLSLPESTRLVDYTTDSSGVMYFLHRDREPCVDGTFTQYVSKLDPIRVELNWQTLQHPNDCEEMFVEEQLLVDTRGRLWTPIDENVIVFEPSVFGIDVVEDEHYIIYSEFNSGFYGDGELEVGPDGRFWSMDSSGDALVWLDPDVDELEKPLPSWTGILVKEWEARLGLLYGSLGVVLVGMFLAVSSSRKKVKK